MLTDPVFIRRLDSLYLLARKVPDPDDPRNRYLRDHRVVLISDGCLGAVRLPKRVELLEIGGPLENMGIVAANAAYLPNGVGRLAVCCQVASSFCKPREVDLIVARLDEQGRAEPLTVQETGLGRYHTKIVSAGTRRLTVRLLDEEHDKTKVLHFQQPYPAEYQLTQEWPPALASLPLAPSGPNGLTAGLPTQRGRYSIMSYFFFAAIASLLGSVLLRRI
jgi:hypothetical protein